MFMQMTSLDDVTIEVCLLVPLPYYLFDMVFIKRDQQKTDHLVNISKYFISSGRLQYIYAEYISNIHTIVYTRLV
jgi:hypothetical protein